MLSALYAIAARPSVSRVNPTKTVEDRITKFSPYGSPIPQVFVGKFHPEILTGSPERERQRREGWGNQLFSRFKRQYLENGSRYGQS